MSKRDREKGKGGSAVSKTSKGKPQADAASTPSKSAAQAAGAVPPPSVRPPAPARTAPSTATRAVAKPGAPPVTKSTAAVPSDPAVAKPASQAAPAAEAAAPATKSSTRSATSTGGKLKASSAKGLPKAASDASSAQTVAPPAKRQRPSEPRPSVPTVVVSKPIRIGLEPAPADDSDVPAITHVEPAVSALPTLEEAATIAVASDRAESEAAARLTRSSSGGDRLREAAAFGTSQSLLSTDYYFRQYGAHGMRSMVADVDDFGFDPHVDAKAKPLLEALCKRYFRVELVGAENIPHEGRALLVANRAGALPWDGLVLRTALRAQRPELSPLRWLAEDSVIHYPFMGVFMNRLGAVRACPENAERLLAQDRLVAVFPEGAQGSRKLFRDRYRLQRFGRGGYVKLALKLGVPIFPTAIIGAEEINPVLGRSRLLGRIMGSDSVPITPTFPWLGLAGLLPAPVRWRIAVGTPIDLSSYGPEAADDALVVHRLNEQIRSSLQALVDRGKDARGSALFG